MRQAQRLRLRSSPRHWRQMNVTSIDSRFLHQLVDMMQFPLREIDGRVVTNKIIGTILTSVNHCPKYHVVLTLMHFPVQIALSIPRTRRGLAVELSKPSPLSHPEAQLNRPRTFSISRVRLSRQLLILPLGIGGHAELIVSINLKLFPPPEA